MPDPAPDTAAFPGWLPVESYLLSCMVNGSDAKLTVAEVTAVVGEHARLKGLEKQAAQLARRVQDGDGCWGSEQGYAPCTFRDVERVLDGAPKRSRRWWLRKA